MLRDGREGLLTGALAVAHVGCRLHEFEVPTAIADRFPEYVWAAAILQKPELNQHWLVFVAGAAGAMRALASPETEDPYDSFFERSISAHSSWPRDDYYDYVVQMISAIDATIVIQSKRWKRGA
jgi:hypothetical protein